MSLFGEPSWETSGGKRSDRKREEANRVCANQQVIALGNWTSALLGILGECVAHASELSHPRGEET